MIADLRFAPYCVASFVKDCIYIDYLLYSSPSFLCGKGRTHRAAMSELLIPFRISLSLCRIDSARPCDIDPCWIALPYIL